MSEFCKMTAVDAESLSAKVIIQVIAAVMSLLVIWIAYDFVRQDAENRNKRAERQVSAAIDMVVLNIQTALAGAADSLQMLSRLPQFRKTRRYGAASSLAESMHSKLLNCASNLAALEAEGTVKIIELRRRFEYTIGFIIAAVRRCFFDVGLLAFFEALPLPNFELWWPDSILNYYSTGLPNMVAYYLSLLSEIGVPIGRLCDAAFCWGNIIPADIGEVGDILASTLNERDIIRSVSVRTLDGQETVGVSEINGVSAFTKGWWRRGLRENRPFYVGPAVFDEALGRAVWHVGVPLRDASRTTTAILTARIDLGFLNNLAESARLTPASILMITDEDGVIIGHRKQSTVAAQLNAKHSNPLVNAALEGNEGEHEVRLNGVSYIAAWRNLKNADRRRLPHWAVVYLAPVSDLKPGGFRTALLAILVASITLGVLLYMFDILEASFDEN